MFSDIHVERGFSVIDLDLPEVSKAEVTIRRSSLYPILGVRMEVQLQNQDTDNLLSMAIDPAVAFYLGMSRIALILELEHKAFPSLSRSEPIVIKMGDAKMLTIAPKEIAPDQWGATLTMHYADTNQPDDTLEWDDRKWNWEEMISNALAFPALTLIMAMGVGADFSARLRNSDPIFRLENTIVDPGNVHEIDTKTIGGLVVRMIDNDGNETVNEPNETPVVVDGEDDFDIAFRNLLANSKKEGLDA